MSQFSRDLKFYYLSFLKHDFKAGITVFFVALPLCLGISMASGAPVYSGLVAGIVGGLVVSLISGSQLSVSGPAAGLTAICAAAILSLGSLEVFFLSVVIAGFLQILLGVFRLGGLTQLIPSAVIRGMLTAIGILLISKQLPLLIGYDKPDFWTNELFNILTLDHAFQHIGNLYESASPGGMLIAALSLGLLYAWKKTLAKKLKFIPTSFLIVFFGVLLAWLFSKYQPALALSKSQFVAIPENMFVQIRLPDFSALFTNAAIWKNAVVICFVASLETLLSVEAIDKIDPQKRRTPQNRELVAQGCGNVLSGLLGGIPITAVIVRSSANMEAGGHTKMSGFSHGLWLLLVVLLAVPVVNMVPYCVLAVILIRTGYNLAKPRMIYAVYKQGREQFMPFVVTVIAILFTDLLIGVAIGAAYSVYFLVKHTYRAGFVVDEKTEGHIPHVRIDLALNVSFLNKKRFIDLFERIPPYAIVHVDGSRSVYIDKDILEIIHDFKIKAHNKHIELHLVNIPEADFIEGH
ncbi:MAG: sulfate transporter [Bacteroidetes bacterium]|nr:MAG: sulfate transporter [Bacteroidota bacterium]